MRLLICKVAGYRYFDLPHIYSKFPKEYKRFHDICGGSGSILLSKKHDVEYECLNDYNLVFYHMYHKIKYTPDMFMLGVNRPATHMEAMKVLLRAGPGYVGANDRWDFCAEQAFIFRNMTLNGNCKANSIVALKYYSERVRSIPLIHERLKNVHVDALRASIYLEKPLDQDDFVVVDLPTYDILWQDNFMSKDEYLQTIGACLMSDAKIMVIHDKEEEYLKTWSQSLGRNYIIYTNYSCDSL